MNFKRPLKLSERCCQTGAKIFLAPFIRASDSIPVGKNFVCRSLFGCSLFLIWSSHRKKHTLVLRWLFCRLEILSSLIIIFSNWQSERLAKKSHYMVRYGPTLNRPYNVTAVYAYRMSSACFDIPFYTAQLSCWKLNLELFKWARTVAFALFNAFLFYINRLFIHLSFSFSSKH